VGGGFNSVAALFISGPPVIAHVSVGWEDAVKLECGMVEARVICSGLLEYLKCYVQLDRRKEILGWRANSSLIYT
jgi:hypothetical protein